MKTVAISSGGRALWIDQLRILSCLAVVFIHVTGDSYNRFTSPTLGEWWLANIVNGTARAAVPIFVMISGALMKESDCEPTYFYRKKAMRLLPVILGWTSLYAFFDIFVLGISPKDVAVTAISKGFVYLHLWYLTMLVFLLAFAPFLARYKYSFSGGKRGQLMLLWICIATISFDWVVEILCRINLVPFTGWTRTFVEFIPYFLLGLLLSGPNPVRPAFRAGYYLLAATVGCWIANYTACRFFGIVEDTMPLANRSPFVMAVAVTVFLLVRKGIAFGRSSVCLHALADASLGIYLLHPLFIWLFRRLLRDTELDIVNGWWTFPTAIITYLFSFACISTFRRSELGRILS